MPTNTADLSSDGSGDGGGEDEFDLDRLKEVAGFLVRAPRRRPRLAVTILCVTLVFGVLAAKYLPRQYRCDVRILAQRNLVLPALDNPNRAIPHEADAPTKNAADTILRRDNIVALVQQLDLIHRWQTTRQPILRVKDKITSIFGTKTDEERMRDMIDLLNSRLTVTSDESSITIALEWPDREMAYEIVSNLQKNFLEARYDTNVNVIVEAIRILEERAKPQATEVDSALAELTRIESERNEAALKAAGRLPTAATTATGTWRAPAPDTRTTASRASGNDDVAKELQDVRRRIRVMTEERERQLADAQRQLVDARATLGPLHPTVVALNDKIAKLQEVPTELKALDAKERDLVAQLAASRPSDAPAPSTSAQAVTPAPPQTPVVPTVPLPTPGLPVELRDDSRTTLARQKLTAETAKYGELLSRIQAANIELEVTRAAFKYQYTVVRPAELARKPSKPNSMLIYLATALLAPLLALLIPAALDLSRGRFLEPWQVERKLKLPVLGDLRLPP